LVCGIVVLVLGFGWYATRPVEPPCPFAIAWSSLIASEEVDVEQILAEKRASGECAPVETRWRGWFD
jgi:hypothetical protein